MKHLFIINPEAAGVKGKARSISQRITLFFQQYPDISYHIHMTRWSRDALAFSNRFATAEYLSDTDGLIRIHIIGGMGTVYEVINGITGLPGVQIAVYPYGSAADFLKVFGDSHLNIFSSFDHQVFSETIPLDILKCDNNFAFAYSYIGLSAGVTDFIKLMRNKKLFQNYEITIDDRYMTGDCVSLLVTNLPISNEKLFSTTDVLPDDGMLDLFIVKKLPYMNRINQILHYMLFNYKFFPDYIIHETGRHIRISSKEMLYCQIDGEVHYETTMDYRLLPQAIDFVCPSRHGGLSG